MNYAATLSPAVSRLELFPLTSASFRRWPAGFYTTLLDARRYDAADDDE